MLLTGGLPPYISVASAALDTYRRTFQRVVKQNERCVRGGGKGLCLAASKLCPPTPACDVRGGRRLSLARSAPRS